MKKWVKPILFGIIGLIFIVISLFTPWYYLIIEIDYGDFSEELHSEYTLREVTNKTRLRNTEVITKDELNDNQGLSVESAFWFTSNLVIFTTILIILFLVVFFIGDKKQNVFIMKGGIFICTISILIALFAPFYLYMNLPRAFENDLENQDYSPISKNDYPGYAKQFFGKDTVQSSDMKSKTSWGGSIGWFLMIPTIITMIIANILARKQVFFLKDDKSKKEDISIRNKNEVTSEFKCPKCGKEFDILDEKRPIEIKCPNCGVKGLIK